MRISRILAVAIACVASLSSSDSRAACDSPETPVIQSHPTTVSLEQPYTIEWSSTAGTTGYYIVERSTSTAFDINSESQFLSGNAASFVPLTVGTFFHRVTAVAGCDRTVRSATSTPVQVTVSESAILQRAQSPAIATGEIRRGLFGAAPSDQATFILPQVVKAPGVGNIQFLSRLTLTNASVTPVAIDAVFVPQGSFIDSDNLPGASLTIAGNGSRSFEDVIGELFGLGFALGSMEIRSPNRSVRVVTSTAPVYARLLSGTERDLFSPVFLRSEGARIGRPQTLPGVVSTSRVRTIAYFVETERSSTTTPTAVAIGLLNSDGELLGSQVISLRSGESFATNIDRLLAPGAYLSDGSVSITVLSGNGTVAGCLRQFDNLTNEQLRGHSSEATEDPASAELQSPSAGSVTTYAVFGAVQGKPPDAPVSYRTLVGITAPRNDATCTISLLSDRVRAAPVVNVTVRATKTVEFTDALWQLFGISPDLPTRGTIVVETTGGVVVYGTLISPESQGSGQAVGNLPVIPLASEAIIGATAGLQRPIFFTGAEQFVDPNKGRRWKLGLTELGGAPVVVTVLLYEASNAIRPFARKEFSMTSRQHLVLDTVFSALGVAGVNLINVQVVVVQKSGRGRVAALATGMYVESGVQNQYILTPSGGIRSDGVSLAMPIIPPVPPFEVGRQRAIRR